MAGFYLSDIPTGNHNAFGMVRELKEPPQAIGQEWEQVFKIVGENVPNGLYIVNGGITYRAGDTNKENIFRSVVFGVPDQAIVAEIKDTDEVLYLPFRFPVDVKEGFIDVAIEGQQIGGGTGESLEVLACYLDYEKKSDFTQKPLLLAEGETFKKLIHRS